MSEYILVQTSGQAPATLIWRHQTLRSAVDAAEKISRDCNAEFVVAEVVGEVKRRTEWKPVVIDGSST